MKISRSPCRRAFSIAKHAASSFPGLTRFPTVLGSGYFESNTDADRTVCSVSSYPSLTAHLIVAYSQTAPPLMYRDVLFAHCGLAKSKHHLDGFPRTISSTLDHHHLAHSLCIFCSSMRLSSFALVVVLTDGRSPGTSTLRGMESWLSSVQMSAQ